MAAQQLVELLRNQPSAQQTYSASNSISDALSSLFPSVVRTSGAQATPSSVRPTPTSGTSNNATWRGLKYEPAGKKKRTSKGTGPALYQEKGEKSKEILKDIFLVPNPKASKVPRGKAGEELCSNGFVSFAVSLNTAMSEQDVIQKVVVELANKFALCQGKTFELMKAVNDKLIGQDQKTLNQKLMMQTYSQPALRSSIRISDTNQSDEEEPFFSATGDEWHGPLELQDDGLSLKDAIKHLSVNIEKELKENRLDVRRKSPWKDFCEIRNRRKFSVNAKLKVRFIGEAAIDTAGPLREFFSVLLDQIHSSLFYETAGGHIPSKNMLAAVSKEYRCAGETMALSLVHGGPAPNWLEPWIYSYIVSGHEPMFLPNDHKRSEIFTKLSSCKTDSELRKTIDAEEIEDGLSDVGYRGIPSREKIENEENILNHKVVMEPILPMIKQLQEGSDTLGVLQAARKCHEVFKSVFTPLNDIFKIRANDFLDNVVVDYSPDGSNRKEMEINTYKSFTDVVLAADEPG
eukprot:gene10442-11535_t